GRWPPAGARGRGARPPPDGPGARGPRGGRRALRGRRASARAPRAAPAPPRLGGNLGAARAARPGDPLQRILGGEEFRGLRLRLTDAVLVPRPETESLVEWAFELLPPPRDRRPLAVDRGTGSGCIACALAAERPDLDVLALDVCPAAAAVARENARALGLAPRIS